MNTLFKLVLAMTISIPAATFATTWDEPWTAKVIKEADSFVFAKIKSFDEKNLTIEIIRLLAGKELKGTINISNFYLLDLCSRSGGHGPQFHFKNIKESYFFIKQNKAGEYCIATPTSGFDQLKDGMVTASYRHSYHQALVPAEVYEKTMTAIFNNYHQLPYDKTFVEEYVTKYLTLTPAGFDASEIKTFFAQHVALETVYHLRLQGQYSKLVHFLNDTSNFHNQVSAARAMVAYNSDECRAELLKVIREAGRDDFIKVVCIWTLAEFRPKELKHDLLAMSTTASTEDNGFGGNIMDPRVCTSFPSVKEAIDSLVETL